jgi:ABC-type uncharacterized transport system permease subunit
VIWVFDDISLDLDHDVTDASPLLLTQLKRRNIMFWTMIKDPVVWGSLLGIGIIVAMMAYYTYLFMHNSADTTK